MGFGNSQENRRRRQRCIRKTSMSAIASATRHQAAPGESRSERCFNNQKPTRPPPAHILGPVRVQPARGVHVHPAPRGWRGVMQIIRIQDGMVGISWPQLSDPVAHIPRGREHGEGHVEHGCVAPPAPLASEPCPAASRWIPRSPYIFSTSLPMYSPPWSCITCCTEQCFCISRNATCLRVSAAASLLRRSTDTRAKRMASSSTALKYTCGR